MTYTLAVDDSRHTVFSCALQVWFNSDGTHGHLTAMRLFPIPALCVLQAVQFPAIHDTHLMLSIQCSRQVIIPSHHLLLFREYLLRSSDMEDFRFSLRFQLDVHQIPAVKHIHRNPSCEVSGDNPVDNLQTGIH